MVGTATDAPIARPLLFATTAIVSEGEAVALGVTVKIEAGKLVGCGVDLSWLTNLLTTSGGGGGGGANPGNNLHVAKAAVVYDPHTRDSRGFAFVTMDTVEEAEAAITGLHNTDLAGKPMTVEKVRGVQPLHTTFADLNSRLAAAGRAHQPLASTLGLLVAMITGMGVVKIVMALSAHIILGSTTRGTQAATNAVVATMIDAVASTTPATIVTGAGGTMMAVAGMKTEVVGGMKTEADATKTAGTMIVAE
ncbi:hypothetical protein FRC10_008405 [Ceratobasidium sp. 414]|nr:hypothetical protein FRC10_008405 [Ceratobasidium sp. 414]